MKTRLASIMLFFLAASLLAGCPAVPSSPTPASSAWTQPAVTMASTAMAATEKPAPSAAATAASTKAAAPRPLIEGEWHSDQKIVRADCRLTSQKPDNLDIDIFHISSVRSLKFEINSAVGTADVVSYDTVLGDTEYSALVGKHIGSQQGLQWNRTNEKGKAEELIIANCNGSIKEIPLSVK